MMFRSGVAAPLLACIVAMPLASQQPVPAVEQLAGRVPDAVVAVLRELAPSAVARGLPIDPLIQKAIEGRAKGVSADLVANAVRQVVAQLDTAASGLHEGGLTAPDTTLVAAGGFAVTAGLRGHDIADVARSGAPVTALVVGLRVAGTLAALGVPPADAVNLVTAALRAGAQPGELLGLPGRVESEVSHGVPPAQAAKGLARAAAAQAGHRGGGPPPDRGHPTHPPHPPHP